MVTLEMTADEYARLDMRNLLVASFVAVASIVLFQGDQYAFASDDWKGYYPKPNGTARTAIVFIPGILGSRLLHSGTNEVRWGNFNLTSIPNLEFKKGDKLKSEPFLTAEINALLNWGGYSVYGDALRQIELDAAATNSVLLKFHYDWRQSNYESASDLEAWLCSEPNASVLKDSNVVFVAHSMGGIVLKHWFHLFFDQDKGCFGKSNATQKVLKIILVGTPHFGSAEIIKNFFDGYSFGIPLVDGLMSKRINNFAHTFHSVYELIPVQNNPICNSELENFSGASALEVEGTAANGKLDLYAVETYQTLSIPKTIGKDERDKFLQNELSPILEKAKILSCFAAKYDFPNLEREKIVTYSGFLETENTPAAYQMLKQQLGRRNRQSNSVFLRVSRMERGDGTVTQRGAKWANVTGVDFQKDCRSIHSRLMDDLSVTNYLAAISQNAHTNELRRKISTPESRDKFVKEAASKLRLLAVFPLLDEPNTEFVAKLNSEIFEKAGITPEGIWEIRKAVKDRPIERFAVNWAYIAAGAGSVHRRIAAYEDIGAALVTQSQRELAIARLSEAIEIWNSTASRTASSAEVAGEAYNLRGSLNFQMQNAARARDDWLAAESLGDTAASENLEHWEIQYGSVE